MNKCIPNKDVHWSTYIFGGIKSILIAHINDYDMRLDITHTEHRDVFDFSNCPKDHDKKPFCFRYLTYKPETDILTESQQYRLCLDLLNEGCKVYCVDDTLKEQLDNRIKFVTAPLEDVYWIDL